MFNKVQTIPKGYHSVNPGLTVQDAARAIDFYKKAFGAEEIERFQGPDGRIMHAALRIGDSVITLAEENLAMGKCRSPLTLKGTPVNLFLYVENVDEIFNQAVGAGAKSEMPVSDMFWGDRFGSLTDPFGHSWSIATRKENLTHAQVEERMKAQFAQPAHA